MYSEEESAEVQCYFCTDVIVGWQYVFTTPDFFEVIVEALKYCRREKGLRIHAYVIMPNHVHSILSAAANDLSDILRDYKRFTSRRISELLVAAGNKRLLNYFASAARMAGRGNTFKIWQTGSHPEAIFSANFYHQKLNYLHDNPVRKGFVDRPECWLYSSARNYYCNDHSILEVDMLE